MGSGTIPETIRPKYSVDRVAVGSPGGGTGRISPVFTAHSFLLRRLVPEISNVNLTGYLINPTNCTVDVMYGQLILLKEQSDSFVAGLDHF